MKTFSLSLPAMYGDHHVVEVRRILLALPGVTTVRASSAFQQVEITYAPDQTDESTLTQALDAAGYLQDPQVPLESGVAVYGRNGDEPAFYRHTTAYRQTQQVVSFARQMDSAQRPLWPCPGLGPVRKLDEEA